MNRCHAVFVSSLVALAVSGCGGGGSSGGFVAQPPEDPLAGSIAIEANSRIDQDTMDELGLVGAQPAGSVQALPANVVLAGFVSANSGIYEFLEGQAATFGYERDDEDRYSVSLAPGDSLRLESFGSRSAGDPTLAIEISAGGETYGPVEAEIGTPAVIELPDTASESVYEVTISATGAGAARYVLLKNRASAAAMTAFHWPDYDFVPGEALVTLADEGPQVAALSAGAGEMKRHLGRSDWLVSMPAQALAAAPASRDARKQATLDWLDDLRRQPGVASAQPNYLFRSQMTPVEEPLYGRNWHYDLINGPTAWQLNPGGDPTIKIAVLDSGLLRESPTKWHGDLDVNVLEGRDFIDDDNNPADPGNTVGGNVFHGTHVAGTVGAIVNGTGIGGVAYNSRIVPVRVLGEGGTGKSSDLIAAIRWVTNSSGTPRADVVNMSLGGLPRIDALESALAEGVNAGIIYVAAAGNSATSVESYPAASSSVFSVSAVDAGGQPASYSNFGSWIDLAAPGGDASRDANLDGQADLVWSTSGELSGGSITPGYRGLQGTSMASPHVAGVMALMKSENGTLDYPAIRSFLLAGELTKPQDGRTDRLGWGVLDAARAVAVATNDPITLLTASPASVSLSNEGASSQVVTIEKFGDQDVSGEQIISVDPAWLVSDLTGSAETGDLRLSLTLNAAALAEDEQGRTTVDIEYVSGMETRTLSIPVGGQLISDEQARTAGRHFVLLINTEPNDNGIYPAESQVAVDVQNGQYEFRFEADDGEEPKRLSEVSPGTYFLVAGTDIDGDGLICQAGEACAEYPIAGLREEIVIEEGQGLSGLRMTTSFSRPTTTATSGDVLPRPGFQGYQLMGTESSGRSSEQGAKAVQ
ncbi:MAG: S8 family serine peptidase [Pseudomonadota bacterium]|nr:S8 family serine peptidase [Pseudomonadota bacterium]